MKLVKLVFVIFSAVAVDLWLASLIGQFLKGRTMEP